MPCWLVILTQHGLERRLGDELPFEARFCTMSLAKRPKQQTSKPRRLLVITMLHCKRGTRSRFWSGGGSGIATRGPGRGSGKRTKICSDPIVRGTGGGSSERCCRQNQLTKRPAGAGTRSRSARFALPSCQTGSGGTSTHGQPSTNDSQTDPATPFRSQTDPPTLRRWSVGQFAVAPF